MAEERKRFKALCNLVRTSEDDSSSPYFKAYFYILKEGDIIEFSKVEGEWDFDYLSLNGGEYQSSPISSFEELGDNFEEIK